MSAASRRSPRERASQNAETSPATEQAEVVSAAEEGAQPDGTAADVEPVAPGDVPPVEEVPSAVDDERATPVGDDGTDAPSTPDRPVLDRAADGRPLCRVGRDVAPELPACDKPEFVDDYGICGGHYAIRPDLRREAYRVR